MSIDEEESSDQLEKLLSSLDGYGSSIDKSGPDPRVSSSTLNIPKWPPEDSVTSDKPLPDIQECYAWLRPSAGQRTRKDSGSSNGSTQSTASSSSSSSSLVSLPRPTPPDGGWGWMVVLGSFVICVICDGLAYCFGVLYAELLSQFGESKSKTSLVGSIFFGVSMILGPFASALTTRFGCRKITIAGGLLSSFGFILSYFANSIEMICLTFSVIVGIGFSFCYITSVVIVAFYFKKRRAVATGLALCGTGMGTLIFAPFMDYLIAEYGWRGLFLIMAGISLNLVVCGMLFRPLKFSEAERCQLLLQEFEKLPHARGHLEFNRLRNTSESTDVSSVDMDYDEEDMRALSMTSLPTFASGRIRETSSNLLLEALKKGRNPHLTIQRYMKNALFRLNGNMGKDTDEEKCITFTGNTFTISSQLNTSLDSMTITSKASSLCDVPPDKARACEPNANQMILTPPKDEERNKTAKMNLLPVQVSMCDKNDKKKSDTGDKNKAVDENIKRKASFSRIPVFNAGRRWAYGIHLPLFRTDIFYRRAIRESNQNRACMLSTSCPEFVEVYESETGENCCQKAVRRIYHEITQLFAGMLEMSLFSNGFFSAFVLSNVLFYLWSDVPYMYAADFAMIHGTSPRDASFLISIIGIFNTIGQIAFGFIGDMNVNLISIYAITSVLAGLFVALVPLFPVYWKMCLLYGLFGFGVSVGYTLTTVLMVNHLGVDKFTSAYGLLMLMQGIANLCGPPFAGWVSDLTGTYDTSFYLSGIFFALSGLVMFLIYLPGCKSYEMESQKHLESSDEQDVSEFDPDISF